MDTFSGPPLKKIKVDEHTTLQVFQETGRTETRQNRIQELFESDRLVSSPSISPAEILHVTQSWQKILYLESSNNVVSLILTYLSRWTVMHEVIEPPSMVEFLITLDSQRPSLKADIIASLLSIASAKNAVRERVVAWAQAQLFYKNDSASNPLFEFLPPRELDPKVKINALKCISTLLSPKFITTSSQIQEICVEFLSADSDARVRKAALDALLSLHEQSFYVDFKHYKSAVVALTDDDPDVRMSAVRLLWHLASYHRSQNVATVQQQQQKVIPLTDDAFLKICSMVSTDIVVAVRQEACALLGTLSGVSIPLLEQALSKKMVKVDVVPHQPSNNNKLKAKLVSDSVVEGAMDDEAEQTGELDVVQVSTAAALIESGSYGALIHALEDEFAEVRCAAVKTIASLSTRSESFAAQAVEFLVDMFNDENEEVRVVTITSLEQFGERARLAFPQIQHLLALLGDQSPKLREAVRSFLSSEAQRLPDAPALLTSVNTLLHNLVTYTSDFKSIFRTLMRIGRRHPEFVELIVDRLLPEVFMHPPMQRHIDDLEYQGILVVVFNAIAQRNVLMSVLPLHISRHYLDMRQLHPLFVPQIDVLEPWSISQLVSRDEIRRFHQGDVFPVEFNNLHTDAGLIAELQLCSKIVENTLRLTKFALISPSVELTGLDNYAKVERQLQRITELIYHKQDDQDKISRNGLHVLPFIMWNVADILRDVLGLSIALLSSASTPAKSVATWTSKIIHKTYVTEVTFAGLPLELRSLLFSLRVYAHAALIFDLLLRHTNQIAPISLDVAISTFSKRMESHSGAKFAPSVVQIAEHLPSHPEDQMDKLDNIISHKFNDFQVLHWPFNPAEHSKWASVRRIHARLSSPTTNQHQPMEFISGLPLEIKIEGHIYDLDDPTSVRLKIVSPHGVESFVKPELRRVESASTAEFSFSHQLLVQEKQWPVGAFVEIDVVMSAETDFAPDGPVPRSANWEGPTTEISILSGESVKIYAAVSSRRAHYGR